MEPVSDEAVAAQKRFDEAIAQVKEGNGPEVVIGSGSSILVDGFRAILNGQPLTRAFFIILIFVVLNTIFHSVLVRFRRRVVEKRTEEEIQVIEGAEEISQTLGEAAEIAVIREERAVKRSSTNGWRTSTAV